jgi:hypothetical protein
LPDFLPDQSPEENRRDTAKLKAVLVLCATIAFVVSPFFTQPFTGFNPDQLPNPIEQPPIQPAGYAFSIWGVIYLWLLVSAGFGLIKRDTPADWDAPRWPLFISIGLGASWIAVALSAPVIATAMIWVMGAGAVLALLRAPNRDRALAALPIGLYAGWLTAASCVALASILMGHNILSPLVASWACLALALAIAVPISQRSRIPTYPIAIAWALIGVVVQNATLYPALAGAAAGGAAGMAWLALKTLRPKT